MQVYFYLCFELYYHISYGLLFPFGKEGDKPEKGQGEPVLLELTVNLSQGYRITTDNFFTSYQSSYIAVH